MNKTRKHIHTLLNNIVSQSYTVSERILGVLFDVFSHKFEVFFRFIALILLLSMSYEVLIRYVFPYYSLGKVCILFGVVALIYIWKGLLEKKTQFVQLKNTLSHSIEEIFYGYMIFGIILLFASLYFSGVDKVLPLIFTGGIVVFALFKYFGKHLEFGKIDVISKIRDNFKKGVIFLCFSIIVFLPFLYTQQLSEYKLSILIFLIFIEIMLLLFLVTNTSEIKRHNNWTNTLKKIFTRS